MELKPCPFCGSAPWVGPAPESDQFELVACCDRKCHISEVYMPTIKWQSRPIEDAQAAEIARLNKQLADIQEAAACVQGEADAKNQWRELARDQQSLIVDLRATIAQLEGKCP